MLEEGALYSLSGALSSGLTAKGKVMADGVAYVITSDPNPSKPFGMQYIDLASAQAKAVEVASETGSDTYVLEMNFKPVFKAVRTTNVTTEVM